MSREQKRIPPFDPKNVHITTKPLPLDAILRRLAQKTLNLSPEFQRNTVWNITQQSKLIESLMLNIPIPLFYVSADENNKWDVIDGLQRLTAIKLFCMDKSIKLKGLEFFTSFNGRGFDDLPPIYSNRIMESTFQFVIVEPTTDKYVKFNIFKRINTGGMSLNAQEIRHAMYYGQGTKFIDDLIQSRAVKKVFGSASNQRMRQQETVLRSISFLYYGFNNYPNDYDEDAFLCDCLMDLNSGNANFGELRERLLIGVNRSIDLFQTNTFRLKKGVRMGSVNGSLFEVFVYWLSDIGDEEFKKLQQYGTAILDVINEKSKEKEFYRAISRDPWKKKNVLLRFSYIRELLWSYNV